MHVVCSDRGLAANPDAGASFFYLLAEPVFVIKGLAGVTLHVVTHNQFDDALRRLQQQSRISCKAVKASGY